MESSNNINLKDSNCSQCGLGSYCENRCQLNDSSKFAELMIIGNYPDKYNERKDTVMQGTNFDVMHNSFDKALGASKSLLHYTYLVKCNPQGKEPTISEVDTCKSYLIEEINFIKPKAIILLGGWVAKKILGYKEDVTLTEIRNAPKHSILINGESIPVIVTFSPTYVNNATHQLKNFVKDLHKAYVIAADSEVTEVDTEVTIITEFSKFKQLIEVVKQTKICSWDFETNGTDNRTYKGNLFATGLAISYQHGSGYFIPMEQFDSPIEDSKRKEWTIKVLKYLHLEVISNPNITIIGQNLKFDFHVMANYIGKLLILAQYEDTMYMDHCIDNTRPHGLKEIVPRVYPQYQGYENEVHKYKWDAVPLLILSKYACVDSDLTLRLKTYLEQILIQDERSYLVYQNIIIPAAIATFQAEYNGLNVNLAYLENAIIDVQSMTDLTLSKLFKLPKLIKFELYCRDLKDREDLTKLREKLVKWLENHSTGTKTEQKYRDQIQAIQAGQHTNYKPFNLASSKQVKQFLYTPEGLNLRMVKDPSSKKSGGTGVSTLKLLDDNSGFKELLLEYRSLAKTMSTYLVGIRDRLDDNSTLHADFKVTGTDTGRISCKDPNLMNMSNEYKQTFESTKKAARYIKGMFTPPKGYHIVQIDYSQAELRVIAYYSQCAYMLNAYLNGVDLHAQTAADVMEISLEDFYKLDKKEQKLQRYRAKAVNFGFIYGMSAQSFVHYAFGDYGIVYTLEQAITLRNTYFGKRPELLVYHELFKQKAKVHGQIRTLFGSKRILPDIKSDNNFKFSNAERQAINTPIQGTSGLMTIFGINILQHRLDKRVRFVNTIHDSIMYYIPSDILDEQLTIMKQACENLPVSTYFKRNFQEEGKIPVSMAVDIEVSTISWAALEEYEINTKNIA